MFDTTKTTVATALIAIAVSSGTITTSDSKSYIDDSNSAVNNDVIKNVSQTAFISLSTNDYLIQDGNLFDKTEGILFSYLDLEEGWDGYDGVIPSIDTFEASRHFLRLMKELSFIPPKPMLTGSGEISLYWDTNETYIEVGFDDANSFSYLISSEERVEGGDDYYFGDGDLPTPLLVVLINISENNTV